ncbi:MAG: hypothetical protein M0R80_07820 [Proteobacteria bacterium]|jgi:hypothetical protein|nr:hypothetical protein [Pseudomonadota bacterium]
MLNDLLRFVQSMESWGMEIPRSHYQLLKKYPKGHHFLVTLDENGIVGTPESVVLSERCELFQDNFNRTLCKFVLTDSREKQLASITRCWKFIQSLASTIQHNDPNLKPLFDLAKILKEMDPDKFLNELLKHSEKFTAPTEDKPVKGKKKPAKKNVSCYLAFDVDSEQRFVSARFESALDEYFQKAQQQANKKSTAKDVFGRPEAGWDQTKLTKVKVGYDLKLYSRNPDTPCNARWGLNSGSACTIGAASYGQANDVLQFIMRPDNKMHFTKEGHAERGIWYDYTVSLGKNNKKQYTVLTTLMPASALLEADSFDENLMGLDESEYESELKKIVDAIHAQEVVHKDLNGQIIIFHRPSNGPTQVEYSQTINSPELMKAIQDWHDGILNGNPKFRYRQKYIHPNIRTAYNALNRHWHFEKGKAVGNKGNVINLREMYELFLGSPAVVQKMGHFLSVNIVPLMLYHYEKNEFPFELYRLIPLCNIVLHKLNFKKETFMEHWAYCLGRLMQTANLMYYWFFQDRSSGSCPKLRIGQRFVDNVSRNPLRGYSQFINAFWPTLKALESSKHRYLLGVYRDLSSTLQTLMEALPNATLPSIMSDSDRLLFAAGYNFVPEKKINGEEQPPDAESEVAVVS